MNQTIFWTKAVASLLAIGMIGALVSKGINHGKIGWYWAMVIAAASGAVWGWISRHPVSLVYASIVYDVVYALAYVIGLALLGDKVTPVQWLGVLVSILGVLLVGWSDH